MYKGAKEIKLLVDEVKGDELMIRQIIEKYSVGKLTNGLRRCDSSIPCLDCLFGEGSCINGRKEWLETEYQEPIAFESKSRRVQVLMQPSIHDKAKDLAEAKEISFNELLSRAVKKYIEESN